MITITRDQARQFRAVVRRGFGRAPQGNFSGALLAATSTGVTARAWNDSLAVEYRLPDASGDGQALVPPDVLDSCQARSNDPVTFDWSERSGLTAQWTDKGIAQLAARPAGKLPKLPPFFGAAAETIRCSANLWRALGEAAATSADESARFALNTVQLRGLIGQVVATDGRQVLVQGGFQFPWPDSVLIPASRLFAGREIVPEVEVAVGVVGDWVSFGTGQWTVWLKQIAGRKYPDVRSVIPATDTCPSRLNVAETDAAFLIGTLPSLPVDNEMNSPITLDLNGQALVRARASTDGPVTQLKLASSHLTGQPLTINTNRDYLLRALRLGFRQFAFQSPHAPVVCSEELRHYVWAVLSPEDAIEAGDVAQELSASAGVQQHNGRTASRSEARPRVPTASMAQEPRRPVRNHPAKESSHQVQTSA